MKLAVFAHYDFGLPRRETRAERRKDTPSKARESLS